MKHSNYKRKPAHIYEIKCVPMESAIKIVQDYIRCGADVSTSEQSDKTINIFIKFYEDSQYQASGIKIK
jgi:hypothetical protein